MPSKLKGNCHNKNITATVSVNLKFESTHLEVHLNVIRVRKIILKESDNFPIKKSINVYFKL